MVNPRKPGPVHGRIQKFVAGVYRRLEAVGSFPNRLLRAAGLITMREHYLDLKKLAREEEYERSVVRFSSRLPRDSSSFFMTFFMTFFMFS